MERIGQENRRKWWRKRKKWREVERGGVRLSEVERGRVRWSDVE
tara:strand:- start:404 stop:535 length:132 start_codon:yes stop_codon:yes gene_type:complete